MFVSHLHHPRADALSRLFLLRRDRNRLYATNLRPTGAHRNVRSALPVLEQEIAYAMGADAPVIGVSTQGPRLLDGRTTWTMTVRVPEVAVDFEGMVLLKPKLADPKVEFPVASIRWMPAPNDDVALVMRRHGRLVLRRWRGLGDVRIEVDSRPGDGPVDEVDKPRLVSAQIVGDDLHMTAGDALGEDVTKLVWTGGNSTVRVLVVP